jgi:hypothetical protein
MTSRTLITACAALTFLANAAVAQEPLTLSAMGSFHIGGREVTDG